jgi:serine/threonine-protein kinase RsbW
MRCPVPAAPEIESPLRTEVHMAIPLRTSTAMRGQGEVFEEGQEFIHTAREIDPLMDRVASAMVTAGYASRDVFSVKLALEEAVVNAIKHGHQGDTRKQVRVSYFVSSRELVLEIEDEGPGFCPDDLPDPLDPENLERACGRGVFLMHHYMTAVRYNDRGNCVTLSKTRG